MDTPSLPPLTVPPNRTRRLLRVAMCVLSLGIASATLAYLLTWLNPPRLPEMVLLRIGAYEAWSAHAAPLREAVFENATHAGTTRTAMQRALADLSTRGRGEPVVLYVQASAVQAEGGRVFVLPSDASLDDRATWVPLREVLERLKACPAKEKLLLLELTPPPALAWSGSVYHDFGAALPRELDAVSDRGRMVLSANGPGQTAHASEELGTSVFAHYVHEGLRGHADGCSDLRDGHVTVKELAAFVRARVERWTVHNRGERQTPTLLGADVDFALATVDLSGPSPQPRQGSMADAALWQERDALLRSGEYCWMPRQFQRLLAMNLQKERNPRAPDAVAWRLPVRDAMKLFGPTKTPSAAPARKTFDDDWRVLEQQLSAAKPADAERIKKRFVEEMRSKLPADERDAIVFAHAVADPRVDPGTLRLRDQILHGSEYAAAHSAEGLRLRLLADLAMRVEVQAWPRDAVEALLRVTQAAERAERATPYLPGYVALLEEAGQMRHAGEMRLWARGYANLDDAKSQLLRSAEQLERLTRLNGDWRSVEGTLDHACMELPWYLEALEKLPELRAPWLQAIEAARGLANELKSEPDIDLPWAARVERLSTQLDAARAHAKKLAEQRQALHAPFAKDALARLERQCRSPSADAVVWQQASAILSVAGSPAKAEDRATLAQALRGLSQRLCDETLAQDRADHEAQRFVPPTDVKNSASDDETRLANLRSQWQFALLELAGIHEARLKPLRQRIEQCKADPRNPALWCELGPEFRLMLTHELPKQFAEEKAWRERERLAWFAPPLATLKDLDHAELSPTLENLQLVKQQHDRWTKSQQRYLARDYLGFNLESPGIVSARAFYAKAAAERGNDPSVQFAVAAAVEPLTEKQPYAHLKLEVTHHVPPGAFGPIELRFHRTDDAWLEITPNGVSIPALAAANEARKLTHTVPLKVSRKERAERTGLPPPIGFLVEARFEGRSYHHLVTVPVIPSAQQLHILVSADPDEPATTLSEIRVRPGKVKQSHYVYIRNLTNRTHKVHVEIKAGDAIVYKSQRLLTIDADGVRKVQFDEAAAAKTAELRGPLSIRVFDQDRQKLLDERILRVDVLSPREYVTAADAFFEPGDNNGLSKWTVHVQPTRTVAGPAIPAQLILPVQRIPGLLGVGGGTLQVELPTHTKTPHTLFAERLNLAGGAEEEGPVYLHIDGVPRAFVYRTTFTRAGAPSQPVIDERPAVRLVAPPCVMAGINCLVDLEVDNAPRGAKLEVALGRALDDGSFKPEIVREYAEAKKRRIDLEAAKDALIFDATIADWTATFDTRAIVGPRALRARLLDAGGKEIAAMMQTIVIDDTPPLARIAPAPTQVKRGSIVQLLTQGVDPESGIAQVMFFLGTPDKGEIPLKAPRFKAVAANREGTQWSTALRIPADHAGPLAVSVHVVNHAGLASVDTIVLDVTDRDPSKTGMGRLEGKVVEGIRPQPNLVVILLDGAGKEIARTKTQPDGTYTFEQLAPGRYRVLCVKPESQRRATVEVLVAPDTKTRADLALML